MTTKQIALSTVILFALLIIVAGAHGQSVNQAMVNSTGNAVTPIPYDACPKGYRCQVLEWFPYGDRVKREPIYYVHADGTKTITYMIVGLEEKPKPARRRKRHAHVYQQPKPAEFKLNPDASKVWANIDQAQAELRRQYDQLEAQRTTLLIGAGVPQDSRQCKADDKGIVVCVKPETVKSNPEKK